MTETSAPQPEPPTGASAGRSFTRSQGRRRAIYGLNVTIAILVAVVVAVMLNVIVDRTYRRVEPAVKPWLRYDLTATRRYSLSEQTRQVIAQLDKPHRIVTIFSGQTFKRRRVRDLVNEYEVYGRQIEVRHLLRGPDSADPAALQRFHKDLRQHFDKDLAPLKAAVTDGHESLQKVIQQASGAIEPLQQAARNESLNDQGLKRFIESIANIFSRRERNMGDLASRVESALDSDLPTFGNVKSAIQGRLEKLESLLLKRAISQFEESADNADLPPAVQNNLLKASKALKSARQTARQALEALRNAPSAERYDEVRSSITRQQCVVVMGPERVRVIPVSAMYPQSSERPTQRDPSNAEQRVFLGEERLTGALVSMTMKQSPLVVFVNTGRQPALGGRGQYTQVAERLRHANFEVKQWSPGGQSRQRRMMPGQQPQSSEPPMSDEGQKAVWIVLPGGQTRNPMMAMRGGDKQKVASHLDKRLKAGDAAMVILSTNPASRFGQADPLLKTLKPWGIEPQLDRIVMRQMQMADRSQRAVAQHRVQRWPGEMTVTRALGGMPGVFLRPCPIQLNSQDKVTHHPLVRLEEGKLWAETDFRSMRRLREASFDESKSRDAFTIGVAAERENQRLAVFADQTWATDQLTTLARVGGRHVPGYADVYGAAFPANSELFANTVYWLAGMDRLIAASPRTQDIRRIGEMSKATAYTYRGLVTGAVPAACLVLGLGVWLVRRRG